MARKTAADLRQPANLALGQMQAAIPKIDRMINDLKRFNEAAITDRFGAEVRAIETQIDLLLSDVFGADSIEYSKYKYIQDIDTARHNYAHEVPAHEIIAGLKRGKETAIGILETFKGHFERQLADANITSGGRSLRAYEGLDLHPEINRAAGKLYRDGHYANAIEDAVKVLNDLVRMRSGISDDGVSLMQKVFSQNNPVLKFNALQDDSDRSEQLGYMQMFCGVVSGLRNPRAHKIIKDDPERALEFIAVISLLAKLLDNANK